MFIEITSRANKYYKHIKSLGTRSYREKNKQFIIEGIRLLEDAIQSGAELQALVFSSSFMQNNENKSLLDFIDSNVGKDVKRYQMDDKMFKEISHTETPQGILAVVTMKRLTLEDVKAKNTPFYIFCDAVQDPGNMGTIIRTADAAGVDAVILSKGCVDIYNPKTVRSTMGSLFHVPAVKIENSTDTLHMLKKKGLSVVSGHLSAAKQHFEVNMKKGVVLVVGNEANGVSDEVLKMSDEKVVIPIMGQAESLNAGIASGILMYEVVRQRIM